MVYPNLNLQLEVRITLLGKVVVRVVYGVHIVVFPVANALPLRVDVSQVF